MGNSEKVAILTVLYGTQTGCAENLAYNLVSLAIKYGFKQCRCLPADEFPLEEWQGASPLVIICSNANQGEAPESIRVSWSRLLEQTAPRLEGLDFAVFGAGDSLYRKFNYMAKMLHNRLKQLGGMPLLNRGLGDESDAKGHDEAFLPWLAELWRALSPLYKSQSEVELENPSSPPVLTRYKVTVCDGLTQPDEVVCRRENMFKCVVRQNVRLTAEDHFQAVHHLVFTRDVIPLEEAVLQQKTLHFAVGDALGVYSINSDAMIDRFLTRIRQLGDTVVCVTPNTSEGLIQQQSQPFFGRPMKLAFFLRHYVDLEAVVGRSFFRMLAQFTADEEIRERLLELSSSDHLEDFMTYCHREKRNVVEVLDDFPTIHPPLSMLLSLMPPMRPRLFSISSSPSFDVEEIHLTVAHLSWKTPYRRARNGLCSTRLAGALPGDIFTCFLWSGTLLSPVKPSPLVCIGTGTGVAPLRALIRECAAKADEWGDVPIFLFFGCRYEGKDFLYSRDWLELARDHLSQLKVLPAFSRDGETKFYVQHQLGQHAKSVGQLLNAGSYIYVCGNSTQMPKDVSATLEDIATQCCCDGGQAQGQEYMRQLQKQGRYMVDTWSV